MSAISCAQCRFLAGAKVPANRRTTRTRAAVVAPVAKFGYVAVQRPIDDLAGDGLAAFPV